MLKKTIVTAVALSALVAAGTAFAQTNTAGTAAKPLPVVFPIAELGGCGSQSACKLYCDDASHSDACLSYAQTHGLMAKDEVDKARDYLKQRVASSTPPRQSAPATSSIDAVLAAGGGPGGCTTRDECKTFCDDSANSAACLKFAQDHKLMTPEQIALAKKLQAQVGPGGCKGDDCKTYCADPSHEQVCIEFARTNGFISQDDAAKRAQRLQTASTTGQLPPLDIGRPFTTGSTTAPAPKNSDARPAATKPSPGANTAKPPVKEAPKPPPTPSFATGTPASSNSGEPNIDYSKPPYHCTPAQAEEGACDAPSDASGQGGSIFYAILHFFGL